MDVSPPPSERVFGRCRHTYSSAMNVTTADTHITRYQLILGKCDTANRRHAQKQWFLLCFCSDRRSLQSPYKTWWFWTSQQITLVRNAGPSQNPECPTEPLAQIVEKRDPARVPWIFCHHSGMHGLFGGALRCHGNPWNTCKMLFVILQKK